MRKVFIVDTNYPEDFYADRADGAIAQQIFKALGIKADLRLALDRKHFDKAVHRACRYRCDVLHVCCHGDKDGIGLCNDRKGFAWDHFVELFENHAPKAIVMSACCGASDDLANAFAEAPLRPEIIIGSSDERYPTDYVAAWGLLYRRFDRSGITKQAAQRVLADICATVNPSFRYLRWDENAARYRKFPGGGRNYEVTEVEK